MLPSKTKDSSSPKTTLNYISWYTELQGSSHSFTCVRCRLKKLMWRHLFTILIVNFCQRKSMAEICMEHLFEKQQLQQQQQQQQWMRPSFVKTVISPTATPWEEGDCVAVISLENKNFKKVFDERFQNPLPYCAITITAQFLMFLMKGNKIISCWFLLFIIWFTALAISLTVFTLLFIWLSLSPLPHLFSRCCCFCNERNNSIQNEL